jgi:hypothetical protein
MEVHIFAASISPERFTVSVQYGDKEAQITLPALAPLYEREPRTEAVRRALTELLEAAEEWEASHGVVEWLPQNKM